MTSGTMPTVLTLPLCPPGPQIQILINIEGSDYFSVITKLTSCCGLQCAWPANSKHTKYHNTTPATPGLESWQVVPAGGIAAVVKTSRTVGRPGATAALNSHRANIYTFRPSFFLQSTNFTHEFLTFVAARLIVPALG